MFSGESNGIFVRRPDGTEIPVTGPNDGSVNTYVTGGTLGAVVTHEKSYAANVTAVNVDTTPIQILPLNANRQQLVIFNMSGIVYIKLDNGVTPTHFSYWVPNKGTIEIRDYCGVVWALRDSGSDLILITEMI